MAETIEPNVERVTAEGAGPVLSLVAASLVVDGRALLRDVDLSVEAGECIVVLGANGAGKSTLLRLANGIVAASSGQVHRLPARAQLMLLQRPPQMRRSALDQLRFVLATRGLPEPARSERARDALTACGLAACAERAVRRLSGGEQQRLALAAAWACSPRLLLADEPASNLAPAATRELERLLGELRRRGATLIVSTHNVAQAKRLAERIVFMDGGRIVEDRPAADFFSAPHSAAARDYLQGETA